MYLDPTRTGAQTVAKPAANSSPQTCFLFGLGNCSQLAFRILRRLKLHYEHHFSKAAKAPLGFAWPWFLEKVNQCGAFNGDESHGISIKSINKKIT